MAKMAVFNGFGESEVFYVSLTWERFCEVGVGKKMYIVEYEKMCDKVYVLVCIMIWMCVWGVGEDGVFVEFGG